MKRLVGFFSLFTVLALVFVVASCAPIKWPASSAYSDKAQSGLRPKQETRDLPAPRLRQAGKQQATNAPHEEHHTAGGAHAEHHERHHAQGMGCATTLGRDKADIPNLLRPRWIPVALLVVPASENLNYHYFFFHDTTRPALSIAAMTAVSFQNKEMGSVTNISWEVGDDIRSTLLKTEKPVCVNPIVSYKGERLGIDGTYQRLKKLATTSGTLPGAKLP